MSQLLRRGYLAALTPRGVPDVDILVHNPEGMVAAEIQVKTRSGHGGKGWRMSEKHETLIWPRLFYCLVDFSDASQHVPVWVVPSADVAANLKERHAVWLATPGRHGQQRKDWPGRFVSPHLPPAWMDAYRDRWDLLAAAVPITPVEVAALRSAEVRLAVEAVRSGDRSGARRRGEAERSATSAR